MKRYIFFLRHYNDIDNIAPAIYFFLKKSDNHIADVVLYHEGYDFRNDPNLKFLNSHFSDRINVYWLGDFFGLDIQDQIKLRKVRIGLREKLFHYTAKAGFSTEKIKSTYRSLRNLFRKTAGKTVVQKPFNMNDIRYGRIDHHVICEGLQDFIKHPLPPSLVVFDIVRSSTVSGLLTGLRKLGVKNIICLPVSPLINYNVLREAKLVDVFSEEFKLQHDYSGFDALGYVDDHYVNSYNELFSIIGEPSSLEDKTTSLGSIRFSPEWLEIRDHFTPEYDLKAESGQKKIVFFLSRFESNVNVSEVYRVFDLLMLFPEYKVVVKGHTRQEDQSSIKEYPNIVFDNDSDSSSLINWSDMILFWSTSIAIEGYIKNKFMVCLSYIVGNKNLYEKYNAGYIAHCRDDLLKFLIEFQKNSESLEYNNDGRDRFLNEIMWKRNLKASVPELYLRFMNRHEDVITENAASK